MARYRLCKYCGDLHEMGAWPHNCLEPAAARSDYPSPFVISDYLPGGINGLYHHGVAKKIDNKAGFRRATKESGCIEVGNEMAATKRRPDTPFKPNVIESAVNEALHMQGVSSESDVGEFV